ncbi:MAG: M20/M25/M40 family metallo-hydrolase, partial [Pseudomonadales bacterium]|nr:M20/M25/M40 family metallo-hydrolase [Pseudomonadales bacterium]
DAHGLKYQLAWQLSGQPFLTASGNLVEAASEVIREQQGIEAVLSTSGGTSDGRFIAPFGTQVIELGPCNQSIHKVDEHVAIADLDDLTSLYRGIMEKLL